MPLYIGLISGTSVDAVDAALVDIGSSISLIASHEHAIAPQLREKLLRANTTNQLRDTLELDVQMGRLLAEASLALIEKAGAQTREVAAIGSHGQTISHYPDGENPFTYQIGDPNLLVELTGITTIADFRRADIAAGGQGAPLAPAFHHAVLASEEVSRVVLNVGGIANVTILRAGEAARTLGFDTGPGNGLMDAWAQRHINQPFDESGRWASTGTVNDPLLGVLRDDPYFSRAAPKSTGKEHFNLRWLDARLGRFDGVAPADVQRTLVELTTSTIAQAVTSAIVPPDELLICGGGGRNPLIRQCLCSALPQTKVLSTADRGIDPDFVEAMTFAWLASRTLYGLTGNLPSVTGARHETVLGAIYPGATRWVKD